MKTTRLIAFTLAVLIPCAVSSQDAPTTTSPEECAATFSARLAAARAEIEAFTRAHHDQTFAQRRVAENLACESDDRTHRISLVLPPITANMDREANLRFATGMLQILCYGVASPRCDNARDALRASRDRHAP